MATVQLDGALIRDEATFHAESQKAFGFPEFYGHTMDAWIDCLSYLRDEEAMAKIQLGPDEILTIEILHADAFKLAAPDLLEELTFCVEAINERYDDYGEKPALALRLR